MGLHAQGKAVANEKQFHRGFRLSKSVRPRASGHGLQLGGIEMGRSRMELRAGNDQPCFTKTRLRPSDLAR